MGVILRPTRAANPPRQLDAQHDRPTAPRSALEDGDARDLHPIDLVVLLVHVRPDEQRERGCARHHTLDLVACVVGHAAFSLVWGCGVQGDIQETGGPSAIVSKAAKVPALQPTLWSPVAQWALSPYGQGRGNVLDDSVWDRSGNAYTLNATNIHAMQDLIPGNLAMLAVQDMWAGQKNPAPARLRTLGPCTWTWRMCARAYGGYEGFVYENTGWARIPIALEGALGTGNSADNVISTILFSADTARKFGVYRETGSKVGATALCSTLSYPRDGRWHFMSFRRAADGACTFGIDLTYETIAITPPTGGSNCSLWIGRGPTSANTAVWSLMADVCMWDQRLDNDQIGQLYRVAMGL